MHICREICKNFRKLCLNVATDKCDKAFLPKIITQELNISVYMPFGIFILYNGKSELQEQNTEHLTEFNTFSLKEFPISISINITCPHNSLNAVNNTEIEITASLFKI